MNTPSYVDLHDHSVNSRLDGAIAIESYVRFCKENNMPGCTILDHGNMSGAIELYTTCQEVGGVNPIVGQEIYLVDDHTAREGQRYHEGLLAMDWHGYQNLVKLSSLGFTDGLRRGMFPCLDDEQIKLYNSGLICLSGCISSRLARTIMGGRAASDALLDRAEQALLYAKDEDAVLEARRRAQRIATQAVGAHGQKKTRLMAESSQLHEFVDQVQAIIAADGLAAYVLDLHTQARTEWERAWAAGKQIVERRLAVFGDRYYLETQINPSQDQQAYNNFVRQLGEEYGIPCVVTGDAHYLRKEDADLHRQMLRIRTANKKVPATKKEAKQVSFPDDQANAILATAGDADELGLLFDEIIKEEMACIGKQPRIHTKKYAADRKRWVTNAQLYFLANTGDVGEEGEDDEVSEETVSVDAIDPGRAYHEWSPEFYVRTPQQMLDDGALPEELENTLKVNARINLQLNLNTAENRVVHMPHFPIPTVLDEFGCDRRLDYAGYLAHLCQTGLRQYLDEHPDYDAAKYHTRLSYELGVISEAGFSQYFLIVWDYINYIREIGGLTGPGRGSAAASLVTFLLGITKRIDPVQYSDLMFERFLTPGRPDLPDIDTDFDFDSAERVFHYCQERYGTEKVAKIGTFSEIGARQALADMGRVLDVDYLDREKATKFFKEWRPDDEDVKEDNKALFSLADVVEREPELTALRDKSELHKQWFDYANKLQGMKRNASQHASGVAIASDDLMALGVPLMASYNKQRDQTIITTQFDMDELAKLGIPKFDQLKLSSLNTIAETERLIGADFSIEEVPLDDRLTFRSLSLGDNLGVFQVAQPKVRQVMKAVRPQTLEDLAAVITIIRPGLFAKDEETGYTMEELYKARRQGSVPVKYFAPFLEPITKNSQGIMIYQEHVLKVLWDSGMDPLEADKLRKILSKKQMSKAKEYEERFIAGIQERQGLTAEQATQLWAMVVEFAAYGFNAAHAYAYGLIAYWTSYLKTHHPAQFMAATLTVQSQKSSKAARELIPKLLEDCSQMGRGLEVLPPNVNRSNRGFSIELKPTDSGLVEAIRFGLGGIKGVGSLADHIIEERMAGEFLDFEDFDRRLGVRLGQRPNKTALTALAYAGAFDDWFSHRSKAVWAIDVAREDVKYKREALLQDGFTAEKAASLAQKQAELCGNFYFVRDNLEVLGTDKVDNFFEKSRKEKVTIGGRVIECKLDRKSRSGKAYHRAVVKTQWGDVTVDFYGGWNDPTKHLAEIKEKLFAGSVIIVQGDVGGENLLFGRTIRLPRKQFQGELREDPTALKREAETFLLSSA